MSHITVIWNSFVCYFSFGLHVSLTDCWDVRGEKEGDKGEERGEMSGGGRRYNGRGRTRGVKGRGREEGRSRGRDRGRGERERGVCIYRVEGKERTGERIRLTMPPFTRGFPILKEITRTTLETVTMA